MSKFDDKPFFKGSEENGYAIQICRDSIRMSGQTDQGMPDKKAAVLSKILEEPENFLLNQETEFQSKKTTNDDRSKPSGNLLHSIIGNDSNGSKKNRV